MTHRGGKLSEDFFPGNTHTSLEAKAGRSASATIADITRREKELSEWALELRAREDSIIAREKRIQAQPMSAVIDGKNALLAVCQRVGTKQSLTDLLPVAPQSPPDLDIGSSYLGPPL